MKYYMFNITIGAEGDTPEEAWKDACEGFELDCGEIPEVYTSERIED